MKARNCLIEIFKSVVFPLCRKVDKVLNGVFSQILDHSTLQHECRISTELLYRLRRYLSCRKGFPVSMQGKAHTDMT